jgi:DNA-binding CsgD family transcriptional regulator
MYAPHGLDDELRVTFVADGACFGTACLLRARGADPFTAQEVALVEAAARHVAHGLRAALARPCAAAPGGAPDPDAGVLVLSDELEVLSATPAAAAWLEALGSAADGAAPLPAAVVSVVRRARALAEGADADGPPRTRLRTPEGRWVAVHAAALGARPAPWAVVLEPARPAEVLPLLARAHELTAREHEVFGMLLRGIPDKLIALELGISGHTAREHVRRVQQKLGVRSRGELQALMHETQYDPWVLAA